jgi:hypothetical protein
MDRIFALKVGSKNDWLVPHDKIPTVVLGVTPLGDAAPVPVIEPPELDLMNFTRDSRALAYLESVNHQVTRLSDTNYPAVPPQIDTAAFQQLLQFYHSRQAEYLSEGIKYFTNEVEELERWFDGITEPNAPEHEYYRKHHGHSIYCHDDIRPYVGRR